jgi:Ca2+-binding EF-hand superfamily protein
MASQTPTAMKKVGSFDGKGLKRPVQELRTEIRSYIRNERDTVMKKWMALKETITSEDNRRDQFYQKKFLDETRALPLNVMKFIGSLKKAVRTIMRDRGGTPYSIVRSMFIYWDADRSGLISSSELQACMRNLGCKVRPDECDEIVKYYRPKQLASSANSTEMDYHELLSDLQRGEPSLIQFVTAEEDEKRNMTELRFEQLFDRKETRPDIVDKFLEAVRSYLQVKMRNEGGTPHQHIRYLFSFYDYDYSNGLDPKELVIAAKREMNLAVSEEQARAIVSYYDKNRSGQMTYEKFVKEVCSDVKPILHFTELSKEEIEQKKKSLQQNPFIPKPFLSAPNRVLEKFKSDLRKILTARIHKTGGSMGNWIREAFSAWDRHFSGIISDPRILQGVAKRLGLNLSAEEARVVIKCYDRFNTGEMHYHHLIQEMMSEDNHFIADGSSKLGYNRFTHAFEKTGESNHNNNNNHNDSEGNHHSFSSSNNHSGHEGGNEDTTSRTPSGVNTFLNRIQRTLQSFVVRSQGKINNPTDILHGTFLRYDPSKTGRISREDFISLLRELKITNFTSDMVDETILWFDTNGSQMLDYNMLIKQIFGHDIVMENFQIQEYANKLKYLKNQRRNHLRFIESLRKDDDPVLVFENLNHAMGTNDVKNPMNRKKGILEKKNSSKHVSHFLSTVALNRSVNMSQFPVNNIPRPSTAPSFSTSTKVTVDGKEGDYIQTINSYVPKRFVTDSASSTAGSLLLIPHSVSLNPYVSMSNASNLILPTESGVRQETKVKNLQKAEGINEINTQIQLNRSKIICEKKKLQKKLVLIEEQRKQIIDEFKAKHNKESVKELFKSLSGNGSHPGTSSSGGGKTIAVTSTMTTMSSTATMSAPEVPEVHSNRSKA